MADENRRPQGREKYVSSDSKGVHKRGDGLGTGPVGGGQSDPNGGSSAQGGPAQRGTTRAGGSRSSLIGIIAAAVILLGGGGGALGSLLGGSGAEDPADLISSVVSTPTPAPTLSGGASAGGSLLSSILGSGITGGAMDTVSAASSVSGWSSGANTGTLDSTVASGSRAKRTQVYGRDQDQVTIMVYMCGTDLESKSGMATADLTEMAAATLSDSVKIVVYTGGCSRWQTTGISNTNNQVYEIANGRLLQRVSNAGTGAMTDPATLTWFIRYCAQNYPANRNELIFWDHGGGSVSGYGYDEKNSRSGSMSLAGIDTALKNAGVSFDFIGFDACLMATVETGLMLDPYADYMIASEETEPGIGWYYTDWLTKLSADPAMSTVEIGRNITDDFVTTCARRCRGQSATLSVVDLAELSNTAPDTLKRFSQSLSGMISNREYAAISSARSGAREFARSSAIDQIDLVDFAGNVGNSEGQALAEALLGAVKYNRTSSDMSNAYGLSIYFPYRKTSSVSAAVRTYDAIGLDSSYSEAIRAFASLESSGQVSTGGAGSAFGSLMGSFVPSSGSADIIGGLLGSFLGGGGMDFFSDRALTQQETADYIADNFFDADNLTWQHSAELAAPVVAMPEDQWALVQDIEVNMFYDDGAGFIDLGIDNVFEFDENGYLLGDSDGTWLAVDSQPVAYYHEYDVWDEGGTMLSYGTVPCLLNGERAELLVVLEHGRGTVTGARYVYTDGETATVAKSMTELSEGDAIDFVCDYYSYDGAYLDSYLLGETETWSGDWTIDNAPVDPDGAGAVRVTWRFTDIYNQNYWTAPLEF